MLTHRDVPHTDAHICARTLAHTRAKFTVPGPVTVRRLWYFNGTECFKKNGQIHTRTPNLQKVAFDVCPSNSKQDRKLEVGTNILGRMVCDI